MLCRLRATIYNQQNPDIKRPLRVGPFRYVSEQKSQGKAQFLLKLGWIFVLFLPTEEERTWN